MAKFIVSLDGQVHFPFDNEEEAREFAEGIIKFEKLVKKEICTEVVIFVKEENEDCK